MIQLQSPPRKSLANRDAAVIWHPFTQMKTAADPIGIARASGLYLYDEDGKAYMDAISSWWVNIHGHCHPHLIQAITSQIQRLEHVIFAGFTHEPAIELAEKLLALLPPGQSRIFYSDNGSTAVEVAIKMALQFWYNKGIARKKVVALTHSYHGDTFGSMAVSSPGIFTAPYRDLLFSVDFIELPVSEAQVNEFERVVQQPDTAAFIFEPLIQGSGGMKMHSPSIIDRLIRICRDNNVLIIADEVMTGFGRTGKTFAVDHLEHKPDMICLSKGLTGGTMPLGVTSCNSHIYEAFLSDERQKMFFHGHSYTANPLACAAGVASLELLLAAETQAAITMIGAHHARFFSEIREHPRVGGIRKQGTILAFEWATGQDTSYFNTIRDTLYDFFLSKGILLRPLGNVLYIMPPYCITSQELDYIYSTIKTALDLF